MTKHPTRSVLNRYVEGALDDSSAVDELRNHVDSCEFCREYCENYRQWLADQDNALISNLPETAQRLKEQLSQSTHQKVIPLRLLSSEVKGRTLAADGSADIPDGVVSLGTFVSEDPEMVLRVMRDHDAGKDYLQLIGAPPEGALIELPDQEREFYAAADGRVDLDEPLETVSDLNWQIRLPGATFSLTPMEYNPDRTVAEHSIALESESGDRLQIQFEKKTEGLALKITVLAIERSTDFGPLRVLVGTAGASEIRRISVSESAEFLLDQADQTISIRLFT